MISSEATLQNPMSGACLLPAPSGRPCGYPADCCPFHPPVPRPEPVIEAPELEEPAHRSLLPPEEPDMRYVARDAVERVLDGRASPIQVARLLRTLAQLHAMGPAPMAQHYALKQVELRGRIMHGQPPRNEQEWELARFIFDDDAIAEFERWDREITRLMAGSRLRNPDADIVLDENAYDQFEPLEF